MTNRILGGLLILWGFFAFSAGGALAEPPNYRFVPMYHDGKLFGFDGRTADLNDVGEAVFRAAFPADSGAGVPLGDSFNIVIWSEDQLYLVNHPDGSAGGGVDRAVGLNDVGRTTGAYNPPNASLHLHAYMSSSFGSLTELGLLPEQHPSDSTFGPCNWAWGHDINAFDQIVGIAYEGSNFFTREASGVIWSSGTPTKIPHPSGLTDAETDYYLPFFINNSGQVASTNSYLGTTTAFFGTVSGTDTLPKNISGVQLTEAMGLGSTGLVVGQMKGNLIDPSNSQTYYQEHAFVSDKGGPLFDLNESLNATWRVVSAAYDANGRGDVVGAQGFQAALWRQTDSGWVFYSLTDLVTEGDNIPTSFSSALAINEYGTIIATYSTGLGATPGLLVPIYPAPPVVLEVDSLPPKRTSYWLEVIDGIDSTVRFEKEVAYDTVNNLLDTLGYNEVIDSLKVIDMLRIMTVDSIDSVPPGEEIPVKESRLDNGTFPASGYGLTYPTRDELPDTVRVNRRSYGLGIDISLGFEASAGLQSYISEMVASANRILQEATDGVFYICEANVYNNRERYDSVRYRLAQTNDINRSPLGFRRDGQGYVINPLMRYYADSGAGTFEGNLAATANWSVVPFASENLEHNTGVPLATAILSELLGGTPPEILAPDHQFFTTNCPPPQSRRGSANNDDAENVWGKPFVRDKVFFIRKLGTTQSYSGGDHSITSTFDCLSGWGRLNNRIGELNQNFGLSAGYYPDPETTPNNGVSPFRIGGPIFKEKVFFFNSPSAWPSTVTRHEHEIVDDTDTPVPNASTWVVDPNGGIKRMGRSSLDGLAAVRLGDLLGGNHEFHSFGPPSGDPTTNDIFASKKIVTSTDSTSVKSILTEVSQALVGVLEPSSGGNTGRKVEVQQEPGAISWVDATASFNNEETLMISASLTEDVGDPGTWSEEISDPSVFKDFSFIKLETSSHPDISYIVEVSQQERVTAPVDASSPVFLTTEIRDGSGFIMKLRHQIDFMAAAVSQDSVVAEPSIVVTTNPWSAGRAGLPASFRQLTSSHYVATMNGDTAELAIFLHYADADLALLGETYLPENVVIASRTLADSLWTVHETFVDTGTHTAGTVTMPDRFFALFGQDVSTNVSDDEIANLPQGFVLSQNYPNPFNPSTTIEFSLPANADVTLDIYNIVGQRVRQLVAEPRSAGAHTVVWDGRAENGQPVASGVYFYRLTADDVTISRKMMLLK